MDWDEFADGARVTGRIILAIVGIVFTAILTFCWITRPIFLALFTTALNAQAVQHEPSAVGWWLLIFAAHCGIFAYILGVVSHNRKRIKNLVKGALDGCSGAD